jgi:hypothetical protein
MFSNKFWITISLVLTGFLVYTSNELYKLEDFTTNELVRCQEVMRIVSIESARIGCNQTIDYMCNNKFECIKESVEELKTVCERFN